MLAGTNTTVPAMPSGQTGQPGQPQTVQQPVDAKNPQSIAQALDNLSRQLPANSPLSKQLREVANRLRLAASRSLSNTQGTQQQGQALPGPQQPVQQPLQQPVTAKTASKHVIVDWCLDRIKDMFSLKKVAFAQWSPYRQFNYMQDMMTYQAAMNVNMLFHAYMSQVVAYGIANRLTAPQMQTLVQAAAIHFWQAYGPAYEATRSWYAGMGGLSPRARQALNPNAPAIQGLPDLNDPEWHLWHLPDDVRERYKRWSLAQIAVRNISDSLIELYKILIEAENAPTANVKLQLRQKAYEKYQALQQALQQNNQDPYLHALQQMINQTITIDNNKKTITEFNAANYNMVRNYVANLTGNDFRALGQFVAANPNIANMQVNVGPGQQQQFKEYLGPILRHYRITQ